MIIRDLVTRMTFKTDTSGLRQVDVGLSTIRKSLALFVTGGLGTMAIKTASDFELLKLQLKSLSRDGLEPLRAAIDKLKGPSSLTGKASIFPKEDLELAAVKLKQLGFSSKDAAVLLYQASLLTTRAKAPISEIVEALGTAIQQGGLSDYLLKLGFQSIEATDRMKLLESQIRATSGIVAPGVTRELRERFADILKNERVALEKERATLEISAGSNYRRLQTQLSNLWLQISKILNDSIQPALDKITHTIEHLVKATEEWWQEVKRAGGMWNWVFERLSKWFPEHKKDIMAAKKTLEDFGEGIKKMFEDDLIFGLTIGGFILYMLTKNPAYLAVVAGAWSLKVIFGKEWDLAKKWMGTTLKDVFGVSLTIGGFIMFAITKNPWWLIGSGGALIIKGLLQNEWDDTKKLFKEALHPATIGGATVGGLLMFLLTKNPLWITAGMTIGAGVAKAVFGKTIDEIMATPPPEWGEAFLEHPAVKFWNELFTDPVMRMFGADPIEGKPKSKMHELLPAPASKQPGFKSGSINLYGDFHLQVNTNASDPDAVGRAVRKEMLGMFRTAVVDQLVG